MSSPSSPATATTALIAGAAAATGLLSVVAATRLVQRRRQRRAIEAVLEPPPTDADGGEQHRRKRCIGLAVDVGSSSVRCSAYALRPGGAAVAIPGTMWQVVRDALDPATGAADATRVLADVEAVVDGCLGLLRAQGLADRVGVVGFAAFVMNLVGVDEHGAPVTPVLTYADRHAGTGRYVARLRGILQEQQQQQQKMKAKAKASSGSGSGSAGGVDPIYEATGAPAHTAYAAAQLWRLAEEEPELARRVHKWQTLVSLALARWTGRPFLPVSYSEASWTGLLDFRALQWHQPLLALLPATLRLPTTLPPLADYPNGPTGQALSPTYAHRWPELTHARFCLGVGDGACANLGSGCRDRSRLAVTVGTSAAARVVVPAIDRVPPGLWCYRIDARRLLLGGALTDGGSLVQWMARTLRLDSLAAAEAQARALPPGAGQDGLSILPFLSGERAPGWASHATAAVTGVTKATTPVHLYRAGLEAVALRLGRIVELLVEARALAPGACVGASGTALEKSPLWRQIVADVLGVEVALGRVAEATSLGAALLMAEALFGPGEPGEPCVAAPVGVEEAARHVPDAGAHAAYKEVMRRQSALYDALYPTSSSV